MTFKTGKRFISAAMVAALIMTWIFLATIPAVASNYTTQQIANQQRAIVGSAKRTTGLTIVGSDGTNAQLFRLDSSGHPQVDVLTMPTVTLSATTVTLGAGTAAIGKLAANDAVDIGDVTINNAAGAAVYVQPGTSATFQVQSNSANLATETTVAALAQETGGNLATTATNTGIIAGAVAGSEMQCDVVGALPAGTNIIGKVGGGTALAQAAGASGTNLLPAHGSLKYRIWKLHVVAGNSTTVTLSDSAGVFKTDAGGVVDIDLNPIGILQGTAATAITLTTGDASAFTATVIYSTE